MSNLLIGHRLQPLILSKVEIQHVLGPIALGYPWAEGTIIDLWQRCAPSPESFRPGAIERRIVAPEHLGEWLSDVLARQGRPLTEQAQLYRQLLGATNGR